MPEDPTQGDLYDRIDNAISSASRENDMTLADILGTMAVWGIGAMLEEYFEAEDEEEENEEL